MIAKYFGDRWSVVVLPVFGVLPPAGRMEARMVSWLERLAADRVIMWANQHANMLVSVEDVVAAVGLPRRMPHNTFEQAIGRSLHNEFTQVRIEQTVKTLVERNMIMTDIAFAMDYSGPEKLARLLREIGTGPSTYRKKIND
jgi:transcriptional regulator GlxA family with amidase domain